MKRVAAPPLDWFQRNYRYIRETGEIFSIRRQRTVGCANGEGYLRVRICGVGYRVHHIVWWLETGCWPNHQIDHKNLVRSDNRFQNLRAATNGQNNANRPVRRDNTLGVKGVSRSRGRYRALIRFEGHLKHIGTFDTVEAASEAYWVAAKRFHGEFARR